MLRVEGMVGRGEWGETGFGDGGLEPCQVGVCATDVFVDLFEDFIVVEECAPFGCCGGV